MGYGREKKQEKQVIWWVKNVFPFVKSTNGIAAYSVDGATIEMTGKVYELGLNQTYHTLMEDNSLPNRKKKYRGNC